MCTFQKSQIKQCIDDLREGNSDPKAIAWALAIVLDLSQEHSDRLTVIEEKDQSQTPPKWCIRVMLSMIAVICALAGAKVIGL